MDHDPAEPTWADNSSADGENTELAGDDSLQRAPHDNGSVPVKQILRWENEGGASTPSE